MTHISDDDLVLMHYGEATADHATRHLGECTDCRSRAAVLAALLDSVGNDEIPEAPTGYEEKVWSALRWKLGRKPARQLASHLKTAAAAAALVAVGFLAGRNQEPATPQVAKVTTSAESATPPAAQTPPPQRADDPGMSYVAERHLDRSSRLLLEVANDGKPASTLTRGDAEHLLASNRLYRVMASQIGATEIADLLTEIEPILLELAHTPSDASAADLAVIRQRIAERELVFKLRVVSETLRRRDSDAQKARSKPATPVS